MIEFVNLHNHTTFSMLDCLISVEDLFKRVGELGQKAVAITDHGTLAAHLDGFKAYKKTGIKFIPGCEMYFVYSHDQIKDNQSKKKSLKYEKGKHLILLAKDSVGYKNLLKLNYIGFQHGIVVMGKVFPRINFNDIIGNTDGLICTSACINGPISRLLVDGEDDKAYEVVQKFLKLFPNRFFIEIHPHLLKTENFDQNLINQKLINIANKYGVPLTTAVDIHYPTKESEKYHDVLLAISDKKSIDDPTRRRYGINEFYVKSGDEVYDFLHKYYGTNVAEEAVSNTVKIADMCAMPDYMETNGNHLPIFDVKKALDYDKFLEWKKICKLNKKDDVLYMRFKCLENFKNKFKNFSKEDKVIRWERVKKELEILEKNNFSSYMLVVADFINWAKDNNILIGSSRGSVGGCLIAFLLGIHNIDSIEYGLIFERFQNRYKKDLPDIDTDFTSFGVELVKNYCRNKYGKDNCAKVSNFNLYTPKNVIPDLVKTMRNVMPNLIGKNQNYVEVSNKIKDVIPDFDENNKKVKTLEKAISLSQPLRKFAESCPELMEYADAIIGLPKDLGIHAAGYVISDRPIYEFAPLRIDKNNNIVTQYEKNRCEQIGLVKMDFLGLLTLDIIDETFKNIKKLKLNGPSKIEDIPLNDKNVYKMIQNGDTKCVFQLSSSTMINLCKLIKPNNILDIASINALGRPSSSNEERMEYVNRKFGKKKILYLHPSLENAFKNTYGLCIYEEQLMEVAVDMAGWDLSKADDLRKLTKLKGKNPELASKIESDFISDTMKKHNLNYEKTRKIWDKVILPFLGYGFNKAHAIGYSINGYLTAYLKYYYPAAFFAAYLKMKTLSGGLDKDEEISIAKNECRKNGIKIVPPDINNSTAYYEVLNENTIVMGFSAIKGMGEKAIEELIIKQPFESFVDFLNKIDARIINKSKLEVLAKAGCFDSMKVTRKFVYNEGKKIKDKLNNFIKKNVKDNYVDLNKFLITYSNEEWGKSDILKGEKEVLNELVSGTMKDLYPNFFTGNGITPISKVKKLPSGQNIIIECVIKNIIKEFKIKKGIKTGKLMAKYLIEDLDGTEIEFTVWPDDYDKYKSVLNENSPLRAVCKVNEYSGSKTLVLQNVQKLMLI